MANRDDRCQDPQHHCLQWPEACWWNKMSPASRVDVQLLRHRGADDSQYQAHVRGFAQRSYSELDWSGRMAVKTMHDRFGR